MNIPLILSIIEIIAMIVCVVLIFIGIRLTVKSLRQENRETAVPKEIVAKSTKIIIGGILAFVVFRFAANYRDAPPEEVSILAVGLQSMIQAALMVGFTAFIPVVINKLRSSGAKGRQDSC